MKKLYLIPLLTSLVSFCIHAQERLNTAPAVNPFDIAPDNIGALSNSVNLFTGDLTLPLNLVSIPGNSGLDINVSISYNSANIENIADTWNLDAPSGSLGLGWTYSYPLIVVNNQLTGSREDDIFYLVEGGVSNKLICVDNSSGVKSYKTKTYTNWIITFAASTERWEITKDDGTKYIYGDLNSSRNTVQWIVRWGNWIGDSNVASNQRQGVGWNLSEVRNTWGERIYYTYQSDENTVGTGNTYHTEASYLAKINDSWGNEVELVYKNKLSSEYQEPHTEQSEPDAYQERYEKRYLDKVVTRTDGVMYYEIYLKYVTDLMGTGNFTKRLLKTINRISSSGGQSPIISFDYLATGPMRGSLSDVKYSTGGSISFDYEDENGVVVEYSDRFKGFNPPSGYAEPKVVVQDSYVVTVWRQLNGTSHDTNPRPIQVLTKTWDGGWREEDLGVIASVKLIDAANVLPDYVIKSGQNCFAILVPTYSGNNHTLYVWYKDELKPGKWRSGTFTNLVIDDPNKKDIIIGDKFVAVVGNTTKIYAYNFGGVLWTSSTISFAAGDRYYGGGLNYIWVQNTTPNPDAITFYYIDEQRNWVTSPTTFNAPFNAGSGSNFWYHSNSSAIGMIPGGPEYLFTWNDTYTSFFPVSTTLQYSDNSYISLYNDKIHITDDTNLKQQAFHFNGNAWVASGDETLRVTNYTYNSLTLPVLNLTMGNESFAWTKTGITGVFVRSFSQNTSQWLSAVTFPSSNTVTPDMGVNYCRFESNIYYRSPASTNMSLIGSLSPIFQGWESDFAFDYLIYKPTFPGGGTYIQYLRNGQLFNTAQEIHPVMSVSYHLKKSWLGNNTFVVATANGLPQDKTSLYVYRVANFGHEGKMKDYPVTKVTTNDGNGVENFISYSYDATRAVYDADNTSARYNKVTTVPGSSTPSVKPFGYTETYFFNGLSEAELGDTFPADGGKGNASFYYNVMTGLPYRVKVYNSTSSTAIAETSTMWYAGSKFVANSAATPVTLETSYFIRPYRVRNLKDGIETETYVDFDNYANVTFERSVTKIGTVEKEIVETENIYAWQNYSALVTKNIISPIVQTKKKVNGSTYTESTVTRWKDWPCTGPNCPTSTVPAPADQYLWKGINTSNFTWWDASAQSPSSDWKFIRKTLARDNTCATEIESEALGGQYSCQLLDQKRQNVIASISNSRLSDVAYSSFETYENASTGNWSAWETITPSSGNSKTGERYLTLGTTGITKSGLTPTVNYVVSFWAKTTNGSVIVDGVGTINLGSLSGWTLFEYNVVGLSSINIRRSGATQVQIDEVRIHPVRAKMNTLTYHPFFGSTSSTGPNNQTSYTEYDELGRVKNIREQKGDIVQTYYYNSKK